MTTTAWFGWILLALPGMILVTSIGKRLLGAKRGWLAMAFAGMAGWAAGVVVAGEITDWDWSSLDMVLASLVLGALFVMIIALAIDFLRPVGSLSTAERAGLVEVRNPIAAIRARRARMRRYREVVHLARVNGVLSRRVDATELPDGVRHTLESAGGIFVKLGQVASTRTDMLPAAWCDELALLRSRAEPVPQDVIRPLIEQDLGGPVEARFASFDWTPMASASIAQVYSATLLDGTPVVVKAQRPGLDERMEIDAGAVMHLAGIIERHTAFGLSARPTDLATEFLDNVREELDFGIEATNARELRDGLAGMQGIRIPDVFPALSTRRVLTEERVSGVSIAEVDTLRKQGLDPKALAERLLEAFLVQIFDVGVFHADPHPGNILVEPDGTIVLIDLGGVGRLGPGQRSATLGLLVALAGGDATLTRQALTEIVEIDDRADLRALDRAIDRLLARHLRSGGGISVTAFQDLAVIMGQFGMRLPDWLSILGRTMVTLEGTLTTVDPSFSLIDGVRAHAGDLVAPSARGGLRGMVEQEAMKQLPRIRRFPERVDTILGLAAEGRLRARLSLFSDPDNERVLTRLFDRLVLAIVAAALGVGSVLLLGVEAGPQLGGSVSINEVLGYVGLGTASVLVMRLLAGIIRDGTV